MAYKEEGPRIWSKAWGHAKVCNGYFPWSWVRLTDVLYCGFAD